MDIDMGCISIQQHDIGVRLKNQMGYIPEKLFFVVFFGGQNEEFLHHWMRSVFNYGYVGMGIEWDMGMGIS